MNGNHKLGLELLLKTKLELNVDLDDKVLEKCFQIQKKYQFSSDRSSSVNAMDKLIEVYVEQIATDTQKTEGVD